MAIEASRKRIGAGAREKDLATMTVEFSFSLPLGEEKYHWLKNDIPSIISFSCPRPNPGRACLQAIPYTEPSVSKVEESQPQERTVEQAVYSCTSIIILMSLLLSKRITV